MILDDRSREAWRVYLGNKQNVGHAQRRLLGVDIDSHVAVCWATATATAQRVRHDIGLSHPKRILEIGCSAGLNCFALQQAFSSAEVIGLEPESVAVVVAKSMTSDETQGSQPVFFQGLGESIPLSDNSVDLVVCHTVIEHVQDVECVISEIARVLSPGGTLHLDAPNYVWPYEPHLHVWGVPLLGKPFLRALGILQGRSENLSFLDHLQFVTPWRLQRCFESNGLEWESRVEKKLEQVFSGDFRGVKAYLGLAWVLKSLGSMGLGRYLVGLILKFGVYPSVLYTVRKKCH